jgi:hypothetical protein
MASCKPAALPANVNDRLIELPLDVTSEGRMPAASVTNQGSEGSEGSDRDNAVAHQNNLGDRDTTVARATAVHPHLVPADKQLYQQIVGSLMHLTVGTRPDIATAVNVVARFAARPSQAHLSAAKHVLRYINGTLGLKLQFGGTQAPALVGWSDADWAGDAVKRRSTGGYVFQVHGSTVSWSSKRQATVALSSTEAEYMAATQATKEAIWLRALLKDLTVQVDGPTTVYEDNQGAIALSLNPVHHSRTKHIDVQWHFVRQQTEAGIVSLVYVSTADMIADIMTKALPRPAFSKFVTELRLVK